MIRTLGRHYEIAELLPHGAGMVLLDRLLEYGPEHVVCERVVREDALFFEPGRGMPSWVGPEYMAQAIAAYAGILHREAGEPVEIALLLGTRAYDCSRAWFAAGDRLVIRVSMLLRDVSGVAAFACELGDGHEIWARAEIKAFEPHDIEAYLATLTTGEPA